MRTVSVVTTRAIAIHAENLESGRVSVLLQPPVQRLALPWSSAVVTVDVIDGQERPAGLGTTSALTAIGDQNLLLEETVPFLDPVVRDGSTGRAHLVRCLDQLAAFMNAANVWRLNLDGSLGSTPLAESFQAGVAALLSASGEPAAVWKIRANTRRHRQALLVSPLLAADQMHLQFILSKAVKRHANNPTRSA